MSHLIGAAQPQFILSEGDLRLNRMDFRPAGALFADVWAIAPASFVSPWWPAVNGFLGDPGTDFGMLAAKMWGEYDQAAGASSSYGFSGVTRDAAGSPVGGVTVKCFRSADDFKTCEVTSDAQGNFSVSTPYYPDTHYLVAYKSGSPDIAGTTPRMTPA